MEEPLSMIFHPLTTTIEPQTTLLTNRIKTIVHHPKLPIRLLGLHNGTIVIMSKSDIIQTFSNSPAPIRSIRFNSIGNVLAIAGDDKKVRIYAFECMKLTLLHTFKHVDYVRCLEFHAYLPYLISGSDDQTIKIFNYQNGSKLETLNGHTSYVMDIKCNDNILYSVGMDTTLRVWTIPGFTMKRNLNAVSTCDILEAHYKGVTALAINKHYLVTGSDDCTIKVFDLLELPTFKMSLNYHTKPITSLILTKRHLISGGEDGKVVFYNQNFRFKKEITLPSRVWSISVNEREGSLSIGTDNGLIVIDFQENKFKPNLFTIGLSNLYFIENRSLKVTDFLTAFSLIEFTEEILKIETFKNYIFIKYFDKLVVYEISNEVLIENKTLKEILTEKGEAYVIIQNEEIHLINQTKQTIRKLNGIQINYELNGEFVIKNQVLKIMEKKLFLIKYNINAHEKLEINEIQLLLEDDLKRINLKSVLEIKMYKDDLIYLICKEKIFIFLKISNEFILEKEIKCNVKSTILMEYILFVSTDNELFVIANDLIVSIKATSFNLIGYYFYQKIDKKIKQIPNNKNIKELIEFISSDLKFYLVEYKEFKLNKVVCNLKELAFKMAIKYERMGFKEPIINKVPISRFYGDSIMNFMVENGQGMKIIDKLTNPKIILDVLINEYKLSKNNDILILAISCILKIYADKLEINDLDIKPYLIRLTDPITPTDNYELMGLKNLLNQFEAFNKKVNRNLFFYKETNIEAYEALSLLEIIKEDNQDLIKSVLLNIILAVNASFENYNRLLNYRLQSKSIDILIKSFYRLSMQDLVFNVVNCEIIKILAILFKDKNILIFLLNRNIDFSNLKNSIENIGNQEYLQKHMEVSLNELKENLKEKSIESLNELKENLKEKSIDSLNELNLNTETPLNNKQLEIEIPEDDEEWEKEVEAEIDETLKEEDEPSFESYEEQ